VQVVLALVMLVALLVFVLFWALLWAGLPVERMVLGSMGVVGTATGLLFIGEAVMPRWERAWWKPPPGGRATVRLGRLSSLGCGIWCSATGLAFLAGAFLGERDGLPRSAVGALLGAFAVGFALVTVGAGHDRRAADAARAAVRTRGWLMASCREDDGLPADEAQRRQDARAGLQQSIQLHVTGRTTLEQVETRHRYLVVSAGDATPPNDWPEAAEEWLAFRSAFAEGDEIWEFNTVSVRPGPARGEEGFARLRRGIVVDWFITTVLG